MNEFLVPDKSQLDVMMQYSEQIAACGLFPVKDRAAAFGMMQIALAEGIPPVKVFEKYHLIPNRGGGVQPALKSLWVMAEFVRRGGILKWLPTGNPHECQLEATAANGSVIEVKKTIAQMRAAGKEFGPAWKADPEQMLRYRCAMSAIKAIAPDIMFGAPLDVDVEDALPRRVQADVGSLRKQLEVEHSFSPALAAVIAEAPEEAQDEPEPEPDSEPTPDPDRVVEGTPEGEIQEDEPSDPETEPESDQEPEQEPNQEPSASSDSSPNEMVNPVFSPGHGMQQTTHARPLGSVLAELHKRIKEAGLTPLEARDRIQAVIGRQVTGWSDISAGEAANLLGVKWK